MKNKTGTFPLRVLVVDDSPDLIEVYSALFQKFGWRTTVSTSCEEGWSLFERQRAFDLIILDGHLPDGDGLTLGKRIRFSGYSAPLVMITGSMDAFPHAEIRTIFNATLEKPFSTGSFTGFLESLELQNRRIEVI